MINKKHAHEVARKKKRTANKVLREDMKDPKKRQEEYYKIICKRIKNFQPGSKEYEQLNKIKTDYERATRKINIKINKPLPAYRAVKLTAKLDKTDELIRTCTDGYELALLKAKRKRIKEKLQK